VRPKARGDDILSAKPCGRSCGDTRAGLDRHKRPRELMREEHEMAALSREQQERKIDEALEQTFPASDTPSFVGAGATSDKPPRGELRDHVPRSERTGEELTEPKLKARPKTRAKTFRQTTE
jgi:hypothetical protein